MGTQKTSLFTVFPSVYHFSIIIFYFKLIFKNFFKKFISSLFCSHHYRWMPNITDHGNQLRKQHKFSLKFTLTLKRKLRESSTWAPQVVLVVKNLPANAGDRRDAGSIPRSGRSPGGGQGNTLQYSCLENPMDRGAWQAIVHWVAKSRT